MSSFFQDLFTTSVGNRVDELIAKVQPRVTAEMANFLDAVFTREEVKAALDHIGDLKAPGPDGMPSIVFKRHWHFMGIMWLTRSWPCLMEGTCRQGGMTHW